MKEGSSWHMFNSLRTKSIFTNAILLYFRNYQLDFHKIFLTVVFSISKLKNSKFRMTNSIWSVSELRIAKNANIIQVHGTYGVFFILR